MNPIRNNRGVALPLVLVVLTIAVLLGFASLTMIDAQTRFNIIEDSSKKALEYAEAGYNAYLWHLNDDSDFYNTAASEAMTSRMVGGTYTEVWNNFRDGAYKLEVTKPTVTDRYVTIRSTGRTNSKPDITRTIEVKISKKQFMHYLCIDNENVVWNIGDECHGPYHTNGNLTTRESNPFNKTFYSAEMGRNVSYPVFYDNVTYSGNINDNISASNESVAYQRGFPEKDDPIVFPNINQELYNWAQLDNQTYKGRTCIYLNGDTVKIRNRDGSTKTFSLKNDIKNGVIYVDKASNTSGKFDLNSGNVFISGELTGQLTVVATNNVYITYKDPTDWSEPSSRPSNGVLKYKTTVFNPDHSGKLSYQDPDTGLWTRDAEGTDMLGLIAQNDILILHYDWPKDPDDDWLGRPYWTNLLSSIDVAPTNVTVHGALIAINGGFGVDDSNGLLDQILGFFRQFDYITFWGSLVEAKRYQVGQSFADYTDGDWTRFFNYAWGYNRRYAHDPRMVSDYPPHMPEPANSGWEVHSWKEIN